MSWTEKMSPADVEAARTMADTHGMDAIVAMAEARHAKGVRMAGLYIPLSVLALVIGTLWFISGPVVGWRAVIALSFWFLPITVGRIGLEGNRRARIIALAYYLKEKKDEDNGSSQLRATDDGEK